MIVTKPVIFTPDDSDDPIYSDEVVKQTWL